MATDGLVPRHQTISIHSTDQTPHCTGLASRQKYYNYKQCSAIITQSFFFQNQKTPNSSPVSVRYRVPFVGAPVTVVMGTIFYPTPGFDIQGFRAMGLSVQYWPRWFQDWLYHSEQMGPIWESVPCQKKIFSVCEISCFCAEKVFLKGELVLWSLYGDKLSLCRNQQMNGKI